MKPNEWLETPKFIDKIDFYDKYYLYALLKHIANYIKNVPIPMLTTWDSVHKSVYFKIGKVESNFFPVDINIHYDDYISAVEYWAQQFYPQYTCMVEVEKQPSEIEVIASLKNGKNFEDALTDVVKTKEMERGIIERVYITKDEFILNVNGNKSLRLSGTFENPVSLSSFMHTLRNIEADDIREYIYSNSTFQRIIHQSPLLVIQRKGVEMMKFIEIHSPYMKDEKLVKLDPRKLQWGKYTLHLDSNKLEDDIFSYVSN